MKKDSDHPSRCEEIRLHLDAYLDDEMLDASLVQSVQQHIEGCLDCRTEIDALKALHDQLRGLPSLAVPELLHHRVRDLAQESVEARHEGLSAKSLRRPIMIAGVIAAALVIFAALGIEFWTADNDAGKRGDLVAFVDDYVAYVQSDSTPVVETSDPERMESWFSSRLEFAPNLPRWSWAELVTGRLCFIHGQRVARVQYRAGENVLTLFVQPSADGDSDGDGGGRAMDSVKIERLRGFEVACWQASGLEYVLVGPASSGHLFTKIE